MVKRPLLMVLLLASHSPASACSCARPGERSAVSFDGQVLQTELIDPTPGVLRATVRVTRVRKGSVPQLVMVRSFIHSAMCGAGEHLESAQKNGGTLEFDIGYHGDARDWTAELSEGELLVSMCEVR